jgi:hypothetical protein
MTVGSLLAYLTLAAISVLILALMARLWGHNQRNHATKKQRDLDNLRGRGA